MVAPGDVEYGDDLQAGGFHQLHNAILSECGLEAAALYGVLESYGRMNRLDETQSDIAKVLGISERNLRTRLTDLKDKGWIRTQAVAGNRTRYYLTNAAQRRKIREENGGAANPATLIQTDSDRRDVPLRPATGAGPTYKEKKNEKETGAPPISGSGQGGNGATSPGAQTKVPVSREKATYWTDPSWGNVRDYQFTTVFNLYPKNDGEQSARHAWERRIGTRLDTTEVTPLWLALQLAAQWYADKVRTEETPDKFITSFPNWIAGEKWNDAPRWVREGKAGPDAR